LITDVLSPQAADLPNRTVIAEPGDALIIPPYYVHRVETLEASINFNTWFENTGQ
jgi:oxalate decarboxylase/phosphoglucose isomerase-like protein (cupin superfamily)